MFITSFEEQNITYRSCSNLRIHLSSFSYADGGLLFLEKNLKASKVENSKQKQVKNNESNESNE